MMLLSRLLLFGTLIGGSFNISHHHRTSFVFDDTNFNKPLSHRAGLIKKHTATSLLEAQAACGGFVDAREFLANNNSGKKIEIGRVTDAYKACRDGLFEDVKIAKKLQVVLDYVRKGVAYAQPGKGGVQEVMPLYEVSTCNDVGLTYM